MIRAKSAELLDLSEEILGSGRKMRFAATGMSMRPFIKHGDVIEIEPINGVDVTTGDTIFYCNSSGRPVVHRVITRRINGEEILIVTRGDNALMADNVIAARQIVGKVVAIKRDGREVRLDTLFRRWFSKLQIGIAPVRVISRRVLARIKRAVKGDEGY